MRATLGVRAAAVPAAGMLLAGSLKADDNPRDVLAGMSSWRGPGEALDASLFVVPPYLALLVLAASACWWNERRQWPRAAAATAVVVMAAAHGVGLIRLIDRTPFDFPWEVLGVLGVGVLAALAILLLAARRSARLRQWGLLVGAHVVLMIPLSARYAASCDVEDVFVYGTHWFAHAMLAAFAVHWFAHGAAAQPRAWGLPAGGRLRWAIAALVVVALAAAPLWPRVSVERSFGESGEWCDSVIELDSAWRLAPGTDAVCSGTAGYVVAAIDALLLLLLVGMAARWSCRASRHEINRPSMRPG